MCETERLAIVIAKSGVARIVWERDLETLLTEGDRIIALYKDQPEADQALQKYNEENSIFILISCNAACKCWVKRIWPGETYSMFDPKTGGVVIGKYETEMSAIHAQHEQNRYYANRRAQRKKHCLL